MASKHYLPCVKSTMDIVRHEHEDEHDWIINNRVILYGYLFLGSAWANNVCFTIAKVYGY